MAPTIISIEGNIGSGKTTLLQNLKEFFSKIPTMIFLREPVSEWESIKDSAGKTMIQKFYQDQTTYSFSFQMMAYISRLALLKETVENNPDAIIITERSLHTDKMVFAKMLYDDDKIEDVNYQIYLKWFDTFAKDFPVEKIIYVKADPEICQQRIARRSRNGEDNIPLDYLKKCHDYHNSMIDSIPGTKMFLDGNIDIYESSDDAIKNWCNQIKEFIRLEYDQNSIIV
jgi:deoxyadenosine/deoxycytidine kinase